MMKNVIVCMTVLILLSCSGEKKKTVTDAKDYNKFLADVPTSEGSKYFNLWNSKIKADSTQLMSFGIVAGGYHESFKKTGDIKYLKKAEQALDRAVEIAAIGKTDYLRALARNYIAQHRFKEALKLADSARASGDGVKATQGLLFDIHMELGNYDTAEKHLDSIKNMSNFGYLIRLAKWNDYKGNLDTTIKFMEKALQKAQTSKNRELILWSYTNLADYYGHAGRVEDSYKYYLKSLRLDPGNAYAKKGIAWIVYSYERNAQEAMRILDAVTQGNQAPDFYLLKAEVAEFMGDDVNSIVNLQNYFDVVKDPDYGDMYNAYNVALFADRTQQYKEAIDLAQKEVENRATPETYGLLAYSYFKNGEKQKALDIIDRYVDGKTYEPETLYRAAEIYKSNGSAENVGRLKEELLGALYELGPSLESSITEL